MIDRERFERIRDKRGYHASWAVWAEEGRRPKDNIGDLSVFDLTTNPSLLERLNPSIVLVGLNVSRGLIHAPLANFHDARPEAMDFKIRYALNGSPYWGAYMTDIIKDFDQKSSGTVMSYLRANKGFEEDNVRTFCEEIADLGVDDPTIVAFGADAHTILERHFNTAYRVLKVPHYSNYGSKETYREEVRQVLGFE